MTLTKVFMEERLDEKEQSIRKIGKLMLAISSCGVLLTAFQADKSVFAEDATTTEATTAAAATTEATTESTTATTATTEATTEATTAAPTRAAKEVNAKVTGTIKTMILNTMNTTQTLISLFL